MTVWSLGLAMLAVFGGAAYGLRGWILEELLLWQLEDDDESVRIAAAKSLAAHGTVRVVPALAKRYLEARRESSKKEARQPPRVVSAGSSSSPSGPAAPAMPAAPATTWIASGAAYESEAWHLEVALWNIAYRDVGGAAFCLTSLLDEGAADQRLFAIQAFRQLKTIPERAKPRVRAALGDADVRVAEAARKALKEIEGQE